MNAASRRRRPRSRPRPRVESLETRQMLSGAGTVDPSFGLGTGSILGANVGGVLAAQPDGKILEARDVTQGNETYLTVTRLEANGLVDPTFGTGGSEILAQSATGIDAGLGVGAVAAFVRADGRILVVGKDTAASTLPNQVVATTIERDAVWRLNANGTLDATFGTGGEVAYAQDVNPLFPNTSAAALEPDGQILLAGVSGETFPNDSGPALVAVVRLNADGSLDTTFGKSGVASTAADIDPTQSQETSVYAVAVQADGRVVVAGSGVSQNDYTTEAHGPVYNEGFALRFTAAGALDATFGGGSTAGLVLIPPNPANPTALGQSMEVGLAIQPDGKIVLAGSNDVVTRLESNGTYDLGFGTDGQATIPAVTPGVDETLDGLVLQPDGKIVASGYFFVNSADNTSTVITTVMIRFNADGTLDSGFGNSSTPGMTQLNPGANSFEGGAIALQPNGRILVSGNVTATSGATTTYESGLVRVLGASSLAANQQPAADYDASGKSDLAIYIPSLGEFIYRPTTPGSADVVVPFGGAGAGQTIPAPGDYDGSGQTEIAAYLPAFGLYAYRPANGRPDVVEPFGAAGAGQTIPAPGDYTGTGKDDLAIYLPSIGAFAIRPADGGPDEIIPFGLAGAGASIPVPGDYDGSGRTEIAVYMPSLAEFAYRPANGGPDVLVPFGLAGAGQTLPAPGDYDGSGKTEIAAYLPSLGIFAYRPGNGGGDVLTPFGAPNDGTVPVPGDYSGSGHDDIAIFDPTSAVFAYRPAGGGADVLTAFGIAGAGQTLPAAASPSLAVSGTLSAQAAIVPGAASPASSNSQAVPSGPLGATPRRVGRATVIAQSGTDLAGRPTG